MAAIRATQTDVQAASFVELNIPAEAEPGDRAIALVFGGHHVTSVADDWVILSLVTGQEAQGAVITKVLNEWDIANGWFLFFDGNDPSRIVTVVTQGNAGYQVATSARDGAVGVTAPAYDQDETHPCLPGEVVCFFVGARNATDMPTSTLGTLVESYSGTHTMGFWATTTTTSTVSTTLGIPSRTGHYRAVLRLFDWVYDAWHTDAPNVEVTGGPGSVGESSPPIKYINPIGPDPEELLEQAYAADGTIADDELNIVWALTGGPLSEDDYGVYWSQAWAAVKPPDITVYASEVPGPYPPDAVDVEWEPTSTPLYHRLDATTSNEDVANTFFSGVDGQQFRLKVVLDIGDGSTGYRPPFRTSDQMNSIPTYDLVTLETGDEQLYFSADLSTLPFDHWIGVTIQDPITAAKNTLYEFDPFGFGVQYPIVAALTNIVRPRYRFLFDPLQQTVAAPKRLWPRADGRGIGIGRNWPPDTVRN